MNRIKQFFLSVELTHIALAYISGRALFAQTILWSEILGIVIVLAVHYVKALIPGRKTLVQYEDDFLQMMQDFREEQAKMRNELNNLHLASNLKNKDMAPSDAVSKLVGGILQK